MGEKIYQKGKFWVYSERVKGWWMGRAEKVDAPFSLDDDNDDDDDDDFLVPTCD